MKNQSRIHKNGSPVASVSQARKQRSTTPRTGDDWVTLLLQLEDGTEFARLDVPPAVYAVMEQSAKSDGCSLGDWILHCVELYVRKFGVSSQSRKGGRQRRAAVAA